MNTLNNYGRLYILDTSEIQKLNYKVSELYKWGYLINKEPQD